MIRKHGDPKVRFTTPSHFTVISSCSLSYPEGSDPSTPIMNCNVPKWNPTHGSTAKLDLSINGYDFNGNFDFIFTDNLILDRIVPMAGPMTSATTPVKMIGLGLKPSDSALEIDYKWGPVQTQAFTRSSVSSYTY